MKCDRPGGREESEDDDLKKLVETTLESTQKCEDMISEWCGGSNLLWEQFVHLSEAHQKTQRELFKTRTSVEVQERESREHRLLFHGQVTELADRVGKMEKALKTITEDCKQTMEHSRRERTIYIADVNKLTRWVSTLVAEVRQERRGPIASGSGTTPIQQAVQQQAEEVGNGAPVSVPDATGSGTTPQDEQAQEKGKVDEGKKDENAEVAADSEKVDK